MKYHTEKVKKMEPISDYRMRVEFEDGFSGELDLAQLLDEGPIFAPWRDRAFFVRVRVEYGVPVWSDDLDLAPGSLRAWVECGRVLSDVETDEWLAENAEDLKRNAAAA